MKAVERLNTSLQAPVLCKCPISDGGTSKTKARCCELCCRYHHAIISGTTQAAFKKACNFSAIGPLLAASDDAALSLDPQVCFAPNLSVGQPIPCSDLPISHWAGIEVAYMTCVE